MNERELLNNILDDCCNVIFCSIIVRMECEHHIDNNMFNNTKKDFINDCRLRLNEFFESNPSDNFNSFVLDLFQDGKFEYLNSRADLDMNNIKGVIKKSLDLWLIK